MVKEFLKIPNGRSIHNVAVNDIIHIKSKGAYSDIFLASGEKHTCAKNLCTLFESLSGKKHFYRPHKSHIVNLNKIKQYRSKGRGGIIVMSCGTWVPLSKREKSGFLSVFKNH
jgi:two-component system LytT family response regulator